MPDNAAQRESTTCLEVDQDTFQGDQDLPDPQSLTSGGIVKQAMHKPPAVALAPGSVLVPASALAERQAPVPISLATAGDSERQRQLALARALLKSGNAGAALPLVEALLLRSPARADLLVLRGQCLERTGDAAGAFASFTAALEADECCAAAQRALGAMYRSRNMLAEAETVLLRAHDLEPRNQEGCEALAAVLNDRGTSQKMNGALTEGTALYHRALEVLPDYAPAHYNLGVVHAEAKQFEEAMSCYERCVSVCPGHAQAQCNMGVILRQRGQLSAALAHYEAALAAAPTLTVLHDNMAILLTDLGTQAKMRGELEQGIAFYERALTFNAKHAEALYNLGVALAEVGQLQRAMYFYAAASAAVPGGCAEALNNLGVLHREVDDLHRAAQCYRDALAVRPNFPQSLNNLGVVYTCQGRAAEALALLRAAVAADPAYAEAHNNLGVLQRDVGDVPAALSSYERCLSLCPSSRNAGQNRLLALNYVCHGEEQHVSAAHAAWGRDFQAQYPPLQALTRADVDDDPLRPLRIGYVSPDLFTHSVSYFAEAPLTHHDRAAAHVTVYNATPHADAKTARLRAAVEAGGHAWRDVARLSEAELASAVREDRIDILVELTGHTANNRLGAVAHRPAPVQVTWIGYPNSTGLEAVDYRITDDAADPQDSTQTYVEELVRLPGCFLCYTPGPDTPPVGPLPALSNGFVTFGSFNNMAKITPHVIKVWARILLSVPGSRLLLKNKPFACAAARAHVTSQLATAGVEEWRVELRPLAPVTADHLAAYGDIDLSLDPFPYAGTTTTTEALMMGVPVLTLKGGCHAHNVGVSLLRAIGLTQGWVAASEDEYVQLAVRHAADLQALSQLRAELRPRMLSSPLCDGPSFTRGLEKAYRQMWHSWLDTARPAPHSPVTMANGSPPGATPVAPPASGASNVPDVASAVAAPQLANGHEGEPQAANGAIAAEQATGGSIAGRTSHGGGNGSRLSATQL